MGSHAVQRLEDSLDVIREYVLSFNSSCGFDLYD